MSWPVAPPPYFPFPVQPHPGANRPPPQYGYPTCPSPQYGYPTCPPPQYGYQTYPSGPPTNDVKGRVDTFANGRGEGARGTPQNSPAPGSGFAQAPYTASPQNTGSQNFSERGDQKGDPTQTGLPPYQSREINQRISAVAQNWNITQLWAVWNTEGHLFNATNIANFVHKMATLGKNNNRNPSNCPFRDPRFSMFHFF